jgi:hypothetical protein
LSCGVVGKFSISEELDSLERQTADGGDGMIIGFHMENNERAAGYAESVRSMSLADECCGSGT